MSDAITRLKAQATNSTTRLDPAEGLRAALDLFDDAIEMLGTKLRRQQPPLTDDQIEDRINEWLHRRPGAELGDAEGRSAAWPRRPPGHR